MRALDSKYGFSKLDCVRFIGIRLTEYEYNRLRKATVQQKVSLSSFVRAAVISAIERSKAGAKAVDELQFIVENARHGGPGYRGCGSAFAEWVLKNRRRDLRELRQLLSVVDEEMLRREKFRSVLFWCGRHYDRMLAQIPKRRRRLFAEGLIETIGVTE